MPNIKPVLAFLVFSNGENGRAVDRWLGVSVVFVENEDLPAGEC